MIQSKSLGAMLRATAAKYPTRVAFQLSAKEKFPLPASQGSPSAEATTGFDSITYSSLLEIVRQYCGELVRMGVGRGDRVAVLSENCLQWALADWSLQCLGAILVPIYPTLPGDQVQYILLDCDAKLCIAGGVDQAAKTGDCPTVLLRNSPDSLDARAHSGQPMTTEAWNAAIDEIDSEDTATIIYTSGTTGQPKGAMLAHRSIMHVCDSARRHIYFDENDVFLCFLPMSHVFERVAGQALPISVGASVAFAQSLASLSGDLVKVRPTIMLCVPRFLESFRDRVVDGVAKAKPLKQKLFHAALGQGIKKAQGGFAPLQFLFDKLVMSKLRERTGGRVRAFVSGGAALAPTVAEFYLALGIPILQGYGLTETSAGSCINRFEDNKYWTVGEPLDMEFKIAEDGEILMRGPGLMKGYYNLPEETANAIDSDGFFHTGDIGEFEGKNLKITDRKKDILVLGNGKNVAPQPIENKLKSSSYIAEAVLIGDGMEYCAALIVPNAEAVRRELGLADSVAMSTSPEVAQLIKSEIGKINKTLANFELVKKHAILDRPFSIETGELTPTLKVKRKFVREKYAGVISTLQKG